MTTDPSINPGVEISGSPIGHLPLLSAKGNRPCPFCGSTQLSLITCKQPPQPVAIECDTCGATGPVATTEKHLAALWNSRFTVNEVPHG